MTIAERYEAVANELRARNPADGLDALVAPDPLTLGRVALLERADAPILRMDVDSLTDTLAALWLVRAPVEEAAREWPRRYELSAVWGDKLSPEDYRRELYSLLRALAAFRRLLPRATEEQKKTPGSETAG